MTFKTFEQLKAYLPTLQDEAMIERIGRDNCNWIQQNHHLYNLNEISHKTGIARKTLMRFFSLCGISNEIIYSAEYCTPRAQGELAGRAREHGYKVDGLTIHRPGIDVCFWPNTYLEHQAIGVGYRVFDEYGQELLYKDIARPQYVAIETKQAVTLTKIEQDTPNPIEPTQKRRLRPLNPKPKAEVKPKAVTKPKTKAKPKAEPKPKKKAEKKILIEVVQTDKGLRMLTPEQCTTIRHKQRRGYIYHEDYNKGHGIRGHRVVGELMVRRKRFRFRSTNATNVNNWLDDMIKQYSTY